MEFEFETEENLEFFDKSYLDWLIPALDLGLKIGMGLAGLYILLATAASIIDKLH